MGLCHDDIKSQPIGRQDEVLIASYETFRNHAREVDGWGGDLKGAVGRWP